MQINNNDHDKLRLIYVRNKAQCYSLYEKATLTKADDTNVGNGIVCSSDNGRTR